jgi:nucleotide-binding universal stress UspA family protein
MKILLPIDGSEYTKRALAYIAAHDELLPGRHDYIAVTVVAPIPEYAARFLQRGAMDEHYREQAEQVLGPLRAFAKMQGWRLREAVMHGPAADTIAGLAQTEKPDLIVMGTHGHSALGNVVLGSVATGVLARCKLPVLLIR